MKSSTGKSVVIVMILLILIFSFGCVKSTFGQQFDDSQIQISLQKTQELDTGTAYTFQLINKTKFTLKHLRLSVSYPINQNNSSRFNPFKVELSSQNGNSEIVKPGQEVIFLGYVPVKEVLTDPARFDPEKPDLEMKGYVLQGNEEIPFGKSGGVAAFTNTTDKNQQTNLVYTNEKLGFTLEFPATWAGNYFTEETNDIVNIHHKATWQKNGTGTLFTIWRFTKDKWNTEGKSLQDIIGLQKIYENNQAVFGFSCPTDVQYDIENKKLSEEYQQMEKEVNNIIRTFQPVSLSQTNLSAEQVVREFFKNWNDKNLAKLENTLTSYRKGVTWEFNKLEYVKLISIKEKKLTGPGNKKEFEVVFDIKFKNGYGSGMSDGRYRWNYMLVRNNEGSQWLINDWGN